MRRTEGQLCERGVLFIFRELGPELELVLVQLALFVEAAEELLLREVALALALQGERLGVIKVVVQFVDVLAVLAPDDEDDDGHGDRERQDVDGDRHFPLGRPQVHGQQPDAGQCQE
jgi:hypothetical protein